MKKLLAICLLLLMPALAVASEGAYPDELNGSFYDQPGQDLYMYINGYEYIPWSMPSPPWPYEGYVGGITNQDNGGSILVRLDCWYRTGLDECVGPPPDPSFSEGVVYTWDQSVGSYFWIEQGASPAHFQAWVFRGGYTWDVYQGCLEIVPHFPFNWVFSDQCQLWIYRGLKIFIPPLREPVNEVEDMHVD